MSSDHVECASFLERCPQDLEAVRATLTHVIKGREDDFLTLGERMQHVALNASDLAEKASRLAETVSGESVDAMSRGLSEELSKMTAMWGAQQSDENLRELVELSRDVDKLAENMAEFKKIVRSLQMLGISTRIESARLGSQGRGFSTLADDVDRLAQNIVTYSEQIATHIGTLQTHMDEAEKQTKTMQQTQKACASDMFSTINANLESLADIVHRADDMAGSMPGRARKQASNIGDVVASLQFHDITRQQVEHVEEAIDDIQALLAERAQGGADWTPDNHVVFGSASEEDGGAAAAEDAAENGASGDRAGDRADELVGWVGDVCALQISQLDNAADRFVDAVETMKASLAGVADDARQLGEDARGVSGSDAGEGSSALDKIEAAIHKVMDSLRQFAKRGGEIADVMINVAGTVEQVSGYVSEIEEVGSEIELIAINASIKAAHTGDEGKALGVLAQSIQQLSVQARTQTDSVAALLNGIMGRAAVLKENAASYMDTSQVETAVETLTGMTADLRQVNAEMLGLLSEVDQGGRGLGADIEQLNGSVTVHHEVAEELRQSRDGFVAVREQAIALVPPDQDLHRAARLEKMLERYTMEMERMVHEAAFNEGGDDAVFEDFSEGTFEDFSGADSSGDGSGGDGDAGDDFGDNIELF